MSYHRKRKSAASKQYCGVCVAELSKQESGNAACKSCCERLCDRCTHKCTACSTVWCATHVLRYALFCCANRLDLDDEDAYGGRTHGNQPFCLLHSRACHVCNLTLCSNHYDKFKTFSTDEARQHLVECNRCNSNVCRACSIQCSDCSGYECRYSCSTSNWREESHDASKWCTDMTDSDYLCQLCRHARRRAADVSSDTE